MWLVESAPRFVEASTGMAFTAASGQDRGFQGVRMKSTGSAILAGTLVAGTLDLSAACFSTWVSRGRAPGDLLRSVAAGPFGDTMRDGAMGAALAGVTVHYGIMAVIAAIFVLAARRMAWLREQPVRWGLLYGIGVYVVMELIVLPMRWPATFPILESDHVVRALAFMMLLVGLPIALIAASYASAASFGARQR